MGHGEGCLRVNDAFSCFAMFSSLVRTSWVRASRIGPHPQYGWDFPEEIPEKFRKDPGNALRAFPGISLESTAGDAPNPIIQGI